MSFSHFIKSIVTAGIFLVLGTAPGFAATDSAAVEAWQKAVVAEVAKKQKYPRAAIAREVEGKAQVRLIIAADGKIMSHEVVKGTGEDILDSEIPRLVERLALPALPNGMNEMSLLLPLDWSLR